MKIAKPANPAAFYCPLADSSNAGIGLFFSADGTSFNPTVIGTGNPQLSAYNAYPTVATAFSYTGPVNVPDYASQIYTVSFDQYSGATSYTIGGNVVTIGALSFSGNGGSVTIDVTPIPEPLSISALGVIGGFALLRRRR